MVFNATSNNISLISWWSDLLMEETEAPAESHRPVASHDHHDISEILLEVALNTIKQTNSN
jgi:hypothetical protein